MLKGFVAFMIRISDKIIFVILLDLIQISRKPDKAHKKKEFKKQEKEPGHFWTLYVYANQTGQIELLMARGLLREDVHNKYRPQVLQESSWFVKSPRRFDFLFFFGSRQGIEFFVCHL